MAEWLTNGTFWTALGGGGAGAAMLYGLVKIIEVVTHALRARSEENRKDLTLRHANDLEADGILYSRLCDTIAAQTLQIGELRKELLVFQREYQKVRDDLAQSRADMKVNRIENAVLRRDLERAQVEHETLRAENTTLREKLAKLEIRVTALQENGQHA